ncbi:type II toxin-antitoxin system death-on-curing family toxin [Enterocloster sp.]|uniref:type II toxin-antitoxin system death-on-curing family toxin n=1 Tax=Enterocloster sp. TaxID=2719315 RepID=UPI0030777A6C
MADIHYISIDEARDIHLATIRNSGGGDCGELDIGKLESVLCHIQNDNYYPTFLDKLLHLFYCSCKFHCFCDGNKRIAITLTAMFLLKNGYMAVANRYFREMENISYHVAAGHIDEDLLRRILAAILTCTYDSDEELKLDIFNAISVEDVFY